MFWLQRKLLVRKSASGPSSSRQGIKDLRRTTWLLSDLALQSLDSSLNMKTSIVISRLLFATAFVVVLNFGSTRADETCSSPYLARIDGQEEFVYVCTLGVDGLGVGGDKLVT